jgi:hypothetical protein
LQVVVAADKDLVVSHHLALMQAIPDLTQLQLAQVRLDLPQQVALSVQSALKVMEEIQL